MKQVAGIYLPDDEEHLVRFLEDRRKWIDGRGTYQHHKLQKAMVWVKDWRVAIDVGAHVGLWTVHLAQRFRTVLAFEPVETHRRCFSMNVSADNVRLIPKALGATPGQITIHRTPGSSGDSYPDDTAATPGVDRLRLDDLDQEQVDFLKIDCEGYEFFVLQGAEATLKRCKPCVIVEQKPGKAAKYGLRDTAAVDYLKSLGAVCREVISGDYILSWDN